MVFASDKQRRGFFNRIKGQLEARSARMQQDRIVKIKQEQQKLDTLRGRQMETITEQRIVEQKRLEVLKQKQELQNIKDEEKAIKRQLFEASTTGRLIAREKAGLKIIGRGALAGGRVLARGATRIAKSKAVRKALADPPRRKQNNVRTRKKPVFIDEPFGLPRELQPTGKFRRKRTIRKKRKVAGENIFDI